MSKIIQYISDVPGKQVEYEFHLEKIADYVCSTFFCMTPYFVYLKFPKKRNCNVDFYCGSVIKIIMPTKPDRLLTSKEKTLIRDINDMVYQAKQKGANVMM